MEKIMQMVNQNTKPMPKILEINQKHPMVKNLLTIYKRNPKDRMLTKFVNNLFTSVSLLDGNIVDAHDMAEGIQDLLTETSKILLSKKQESSG